MQRRLVLLLIAAIALVACSRTEPEKAAPAVSFYKVDPATAGTLSGKISFAGRRLPAKSIDMEAEPGCAKLHKGGKVPDDAVRVGRGGGLANVFIYVKSGLEGKAFEVPAKPVTLDQKGCWFGPRVLGIQTGQTLRVTNSDPVTHNVHPMAEVNREWNYSQSEGDPPVLRKFTRAEILMPVKCNIHRWMRALIGVVEHPYFAISGDDGSFQIQNLPPGRYTIAAVHELFGRQESPVVIEPSAQAAANFSFKGE